jgi:hypothetical protein
MIMGRKIIQILTAVNPERLFVVFKCYVCLRFVCELRLKA